MATTKSSRTSWAEGRAEPTASLPAKRYTAANPAGGYRPLSTFSIVGRCPRTGQLGVAVSTADVGAGRMITWARPDVGAVAVQSWPNLYLAMDALDLMESGMEAPAAMRSVLAADPGRALRQVGIVDRHGQTAAWSGEECTPCYKHISGDGFAAQGNMLVNTETVDAMADSFLGSACDDLAERLLTALEAAQAAGGDKRGRQCSALYVVDSEAFPLWDIRVDEHPEPVAELRRIVGIARKQLLPFVEGLPTRANPHGSLSEEFIAMNLLPPPQRPGGGGSGPTPRPD
jgi:uncharacterized Ntn-hydrolase superfamily protein